MTRHPPRQVNRLRRGGEDHDRGSSTAELVIVTPIIIIMLLLVVAFGRYAYGRQLVEQASSAAARAASLSATATQADGRARQAASASLSDAGVSCQSMTIEVDSSAFRAGGTVGVTLTCTADLSGLALAGLPGSVTMTATSRAPLETYRQMSLGFSNSEGSMAANLSVGGPV